MWVLVSLSDTASPTRHYLPIGVDYVVGRKNCQIILKDDNSISRKHSVIFIDHPIENTLDPLKLPSIKIRDCSKYGTRVNGMKVESEYLEIKENDKLHFGVFESKFRLIYESFVVATSCTSTLEKSELRNDVAKLGGHLLPEFSPLCNFLVMNKIIVTMKVVTALVTSRPIVMPNYVKALVTAVNTASTIPDPKDFIPPLSDTVQDVKKENFYIQHERSTLFEGMTFIVFNEKQLKKLQEAVQLAGGTIQMRELKASSFTSWVRHEICLIQPTKDLLPNSPYYEELMVVMKRHGKRLILEAELCLAVIKCTKIDCIQRELSAHTAFSIQSQASDLASLQVFSDAGFKRKVENDNQINFMHIESSSTDHPESGSVPRHSDEETDSKQCHNELNSRAKRKADEPKDAVFYSNDPAAKRPKPNCNIMSTSVSSKDNVLNVRKRLPSEVDAYNLPSVDKRSKVSQEVEFRITAPLQNYDRNSYEEEDQDQQSKIGRISSYNKNANKHLKPGSWSSVKSTRNTCKVLDSYEEEDVLHGGTVVEISCLISTRISNRPTNFKKFCRVRPNAKSTSKVVITNSH